MQLLARSNRIENFIWKHSAQYAAKLVTHGGGKLRGQGFAAQLAKFTLVFSACSFYLQRRASLSSAFRFTSALSISSATAFPRVILLTVLKSLALLTLPRQRTIKPEQ